MAELKDVVAYLLAAYPFKDELSNARVTKMVYLADWKTALSQGRQMTDIAWVLDNYGPFVWDVKNTVEASPNVFGSEETENAYGEPKTRFFLVDTTYEPDLNDEDKRTLDFVVEKTKDLTMRNFIRLVYSTYPIMSSERYTHLNLISKAEEYSAAKP